MGLTAPPHPSCETFGHTLSEGPTELRAPGPRDPTVRHWAEHYVVHPYTVTCSLVLWCSEIISCTTMKLFRYTKRHVVRVAYSKNFRAFIKDKAFITTPPSGPSDAPPVCNRNELIHQVIYSLTFVILAYNFRHIDENLIV